MTDRKHMNYYRSVLCERLDGMEPYVRWLEERCDSSLEVLFGITFLFTYALHGINACGGGTGVDSWITIKGDSIQMNEPFASSPSGNGASIAYLTCQEFSGERVFDFAIYIGNDNGAAFQQCELYVLLEIDGYGVHRNQRPEDIIKMNRSKTKVVRFPEERFSGVWQMALCALYATLWDCECHEVWDGNGDSSVSDVNECYYCSDLRMRAIFATDQPAIA